MVVYGILKLVRLNVLPASYLQPARKAWMIVNEKYVKDGLVTGVSAGTSPQERAATARSKSGRRPGARVRTCWPGAKWIE